MLTKDLKDVAISTKKRIAVYKDIQRRNIIRLRRSIKAALVIKPKDGLITALRNTLSSILLTVKETNNNNLEDFNEIFETLIIDIKFKLNLKESK